MKELNSLGNQLLIAMPQLQDSWFESAVIYLCEHDQDGAMGLVLNKPLDVDFAAVCEQLAITRHQDINAVMLGGGPVGTEHPASTARPLECHRNHQRLCPPDFLQRHFDSHWPGGRAG